MADIVDYLQRVMPGLLQGAIVTVEYTVVALILGFVLGLAAALARVYGPAWLGRLAGVYITIFRGTPLLIQLFVVYYGLPDLGLTLPRALAAFLTLGLNSGAYQAEYFRGGILAVGQGQMLAARAIGMSLRKAVTYIILPQALRLALPSWSNEMISMIKYTAVIFLIAIPDLMGQAKMLVSEYFDPITIYLTVAVVYLALVGLATWLLRVGSRRLLAPGLEGEAR
jgi:polar amino acid transport system permease protein